MHTRRRIPLSGITQSEAVAEMKQASSANPFQGQGRENNGDERNEIKKSKEHRLVRSIPRADSKRVILEIDARFFRFLVLNIDINFGWISLRTR